MENEKEIIEFSGNCVLSAVRKTRGIHGLVPGWIETIQMNILKRTDMEGVHVEISDEGRVMIDLFVEVYFGVKIPSVAWMLQENVKNEIEKNTDIEVDCVNVHVQRICFETEQGAED